MTSLPLFDGTQPCASIDPEAFFPTPHAPARDYATVKAVCASCHFREPCLEYALTVNVDGIWGGYSERERRGLRRKRRISARPITFDVMPPSPEAKRRREQRAAAAAAA